MNRTRHNNEEQLAWGLEESHLQVKEKAKFGVGLPRIKNKALQEMKSRLFFFLNAFELTLLVFCSKKFLRESRGFSSVSKDGAFGVEGW